MSAPTHRQIRTAIKGKMTGIAGIGVVNEYQRYARQQSDLKTFFVSGTPAALQGWNIRKVKTRERFIDTGRTVVYHDWRIRGFRALDDAAESELVLGDLAEAIGDAVRIDPTLGGVVFECGTGEQGGEMGIQVVDEGPVLFAGVLCNSIELALTTQHNL
jgi:hypothetical protein